MTSKIAQMLDKIADSLESKGLIKEAEYLDVISNTLETVGDIEPPTSYPGPLPIATDSIKNKLFNAASKHGGIYSDDYWKEIQDMTKEFNKILPNLSLVNSRYINDSGKPTSKEWTYLGGFQTPQGKKRAVWIHVVASGAGTIEDPLSRYDVTAQIEVLAPKNVSSFDGEGYLKTLGLLD